MIRGDADFESASCAHMLEDDGKEYLKSLIQACFLATDEELRRLDYDKYLHVVAEDAKDLLENALAIHAFDVTIGDRKYIRVRSNAKGNIVRGDITGLSAVTFRNESENQDLHLYYRDNTIHFVETGYSRINLG